MIMSCGGGSTNLNEPNDDQVQERGRVVVSANGRFLMYENGEPFFWLGDTAWMLIDKMTLDEVATYLNRRAHQGYTVVQVAALGDDFASYKPNYLGLKGFLDDQYTEPDDRYFDHVEKVIDMAAERGLVVAFLPNWGDKICHMYGYGKVIFDTPEKAEKYGRYIGERMKDKKNIVWVLGGDRPATGEDDGKPFDIRHIVRAQARGIAIGICGSEDYSCCTMTYHPSGWRSSTEWFHADEWLDFNMQQNGHFFDNNVWEKITRDYNMMPVKPILDGEPTYESLRLKDLDNVISSGTHVRRYMYHDLFSGAFGHTYGEGSIWRFFNPDIEGKIDGFQQDKTDALHWLASLELEGGRQMVYGKNLMMSRPYFTRIPDNSLVANLYDNHERITATRDTDNTYVMVYSEQGMPIVLNTTQIGKANSVRAWWFDPRTGQSELIGEVIKDRRSTFVPETNGIGNDWVLVVDALDKDYPAPGSATAKENKI